MKIFFILVSTAIMLFAQSEPIDDFMQTTLVRVEDKAPEFVTKTISGEKFSLSDQKGRVVLITFFATWCPHCRAELPLIENKIYEVFKDRKDFKQIVISRKQDVAELEKFKGTIKYSLPFAPDPKGEIYGKYASKYIPRSFVIGKDSKIKFISKGSDEKSVDEILNAIKVELEKTNN